MGCSYVVVLLLAGGMGLVKWMAETGAEQGVRVAWQGLLGGGSH